LLSRGDFVAGGEQTIVLTGSSQAGIALTAAALRQLGFANVLTAGTPEQALALLAAGADARAALVCTLDEPGFDSLALLAQAGECKPLLSLILLYTDPAGELAAALALATSKGMARPAALQQPFNPGQLAALLAMPAETSGTSRSLSAEELHQAWREDPGLSHLALYYRPRVGMQSGLLEGVETLAHWLQPGKAPLGPELLLPLALQCGLADELARAIAKRAVVQTAAWQELGLRLRNTINIPLNALVSADFSRLLQNLCDRHGLESGLLALEVAEARRMQSPADCLEVLNLLRDQLHSRKVVEAGRSSRGTTAMVSELKIDSEFARSSAYQASDHALLGSAIALAHQLGMRVVAVGVATREEWQLAANLACDLAQGDYCSPPLAPAEVLEFWHKQKGRQTVQQASAAGPASASTLH
jgi:EAL domain-containing protein (putative c-di-GMP-specific phosphodiesterase class I)